MPAGPAVRLIDHGAQLGGTGKLVLDRRGRSLQAAGDGAEPVSVCVVVVDDCWQRTASLSFP
jgi:hypothetical protein